MMAQCIFCGFLLLSLCASSCSLLCACICPGDGTSEFLTCNSVSSTLSSAAAHHLLFLSSFPENLFYVQSLVPVYINVKVWQIPSVREACYNNNMVLGVKIIGATVAQFVGQSSTHLQGWWFDSQFPLIPGHKFTWTRR